MNLEQLLAQLKNNESLNQNITHWEVLPAREASVREFNDDIDPRIVNSLKNKGIHKLYTHQFDAVDHASKKKDFVVVTPTASGKTLCYNIPVLNSILKNNEARALFLFPTKALSQDQKSELYEIIESAQIPVKTYTYDGDTPQSARKAIRQAGHVVVTNPDMLHSGILPHHTKWTKLFENLEFVVIDEIHHYRGVFGSHLANVIRRLTRICKFYGSNPTFICCSATIANPAELASQITGREMTVIDNNGAPTGEKHMIFYNPPVVNKELGIRRSSLLESRRIAEMLIRNNIQTIVFARSRISIEVMLTYLRDVFKTVFGGDNRIRGYRGGYLPTQRREIEKNMREGKILGIVATNALELGIDIGSLDASVMCGYPGSIASTWQQSGRAGRKNNISAAFLVASSSPIDQYIISNPEYFFSKTSEYGLVNPDNLSIIFSHIKCAAFELPFGENEYFGEQKITDFLGYLEQVKIVRKVGDKWYWTSEVFPADDVSLRSAANENFIIIDTTNPDRKVIGECDRFSAPMLIHEEAIYIHEGQQYQVEKLDFENKKAYIRAVDVDYYTDANLAVDLKVIDVFKEDNRGRSVAASGEVMVTALVTMFKKIKFYTHENIGSGPVDLPETTMHTTAFWMSVLSSETTDMSKTDLTNALTGITNVLANAAPIYLMCDPKDISVVYQVKSPFSDNPTIYIYENYPGGVGFADKLYALNDQIMATAARMITECTCKSGCPSCVGPLNEFSAGENPKDITLKLLNVLRNNII